MVPCALPVPRTVTPAGSGRALYVSRTTGARVAFHRPRGRRHQYPGRGKCGGRGRCCVGCRRHLRGRPAHHDRERHHRAERSRGDCTWIYGQTRSRGFVVKHRGAVFGRSSPSVRGFSFELWWLYLYAGREAACATASLPIAARIRAVASPSIAAARLKVASLQNNPRRAQRQPGRHPGRPGGRIRRCTITDNHTESRGAAVFCGSCVRERLTHSTSVSFSGNPRPAPKGSGGGLVLGGKGCVSWANSPLAENHDGDSWRRTG